MDVGVAGLSPCETEHYLHWMCRAFQARWRTGAQLRVGRSTHPFEWLEIDAGLVEGVPVRARTFLVPDGDPLLRRYLLGRADALLFAFRATLESLVVAARELERIQADTLEVGDPPVTIVLLNDDEGSDALARQVRGGLPVVPIGTESPPALGYRRAMRAVLRHGLAACMPLPRR
mgnify:FL=1